MTILENIMQNIYGNKDRKYTSDMRDPNAALKAAKADVAAKVLETLLPGESTVVKGKVLDLRQNAILLELQGGEKLSARTETSLPLSIGDTAEFVVAGKDGKVVMLKLAGNESSEDARTQKTVAKALEAAGITPTERSETVTRELMLHSQPINEANIKKFMALSAKNPDVPIKELVLMDIAKIPITKENIQVYRDFGNSEPVAEFAEAVSELSETIENLPEGTVRNEFKNELKSILKEMDEVITKSEADETEVKAPEAAKGAEVSDIPTTPASDKKEVPPLTETAVKEPSEKAEAGQKDPVKASLKDPAVPEKKATEAQSEENSKLSSPSARKLHRSLHMPPKDLADPAKIKKLYEKLEAASEKLKKLEEKLMSELTSKAKEAATDAQPRTHAGKLSSTLKFMDSVNNVFPYVQLPIKLKEENARGDLYVYEKKRAFKPGDTVSALLHLSLDNLGETDILIKLTGQNAVITISAASESSKEVFASEIPSLSEALQKRGYSLNCEINVNEETEEKAPLLTRFLEAHSPSLVSRFSFDMRA